MGKLRSKNIWAYASPYIFKEVSYSQEEENQADDKDDIRKERTKIPCQCTDSGRKPTPWIMPAQTAHISNNPCQISSVLVLAANRDGSQNIHPASTIAITKESALNGRLSITAYSFAIIWVISFLLDRFYPLQRAQAPGR